MTAIEFMDTILSMTRTVDIRNHFSEKEFIPFALQQEAFNATRISSQVFSINRNQSDEYEEDLKYIQNKLLNALKIPKEYLTPSVHELLKDSYEPLRKIKCECGAEKCGFNNHSDYCPKYKL